MYTWKTGNARLFGYPSSHDKGRLTRLKIDAELNTLTMQDHTSVFMFGVQNKVV